MPARDVVVTGVGLVTPLGSTAVETAQAWRSGASADFLPEPLLAGTPLEEQRVARRPVFDAAERLGGRRMLKFMSEAAVLGCVAAREACTQARLCKRFSADRVGLFAGTGLAAASVDEARPMLEASIGADGHFSCATLGGKGLAAANPLLSFKILANMPPCLISIIEGIKGPNLIFSPWEAQSAEALIEAWRAVADGDVDAALAGAADQPAHPATVVYLRQSGRLKAVEHPAPAGAYVVLESAEQAERDGQTVFAIMESIEVEAVDRSAAEEHGERNLIAERLGRSFAAEPAVFFALAALTSASSSQEPRAKSHEQTFCLPLHNGRSLRIRLRAPE